MPLEIFDGSNGLQIAMNAAIAYRATSKQMKDPNIKKPFKGLDCETKQINPEKHLKIVFFTVQPFTVKMEFEIYKYFPLFFLSPVLFCGLCSTRPKISFTSFLQPA